jgi:hypothetical protein
MIQTNPGSRGQKGTSSRIRSTAKNFLKDPDPRIRNPEIWIREANNIPIQNLPGHFSGH